MLLQPTKLSVFKEIGDKEQEIMMVETRMRPITRGIPLKTNGTLSDHIRRDYTNVENKVEKLKDQIFIGGENEQQFLTKQNGDSPLGKYFEKAIKGDFDNAKGVNGSST